MRQIQLLLLLAALCSAPFCLQAQWTKTNGLRGGTASKFVAWGDTILIHNYSNTIPYSTNSGQTWSQLPLPTDVYVWDLAASGDLLAVRSYDYTAGKASVSASSDRGQTWVKVPIADTMQFSEIHVIEQYIYGSDSKGVYRSADMGATWQYVTKKWTSSLLYDGQRLTAFRYPYIVQSLDLGLTWDTLLKTTGNLIHLFQHDQHIIAFMQAAANGCYVSADYGKTWQQRTGREFDQTHSPFWHKGVVYVPDYKAILRSADLCKTWTELDPPGSTSLITGFSDGQSMLASDLYSGIFRSSDNGDSWFPTYIGLVAQEANSLREIDGTLYATGKEGPFRLAPDGLNWTLWPLPIQGDWVGFSDIIKSGYNWLVGHESDFWRSLYGGATWL